jgi:CBS domain-containing protein
VTGLLYVKDIMTNKVRTIGPDETVGEAAKMMSRFRIGSLIVVDKSGRPVGIITEGDVSRAVARGSNPSNSAVRTIMSKKLITTHPGERVEEAAKLMADAQVKKLPVVEEGRLVGIVTQTDIVGSSFELITSLKEMVRARYRPPEFQP